MSTVRQATLDDMRHLMRLGAWMFEESRYGDKFAYDAQMVAAVFQRYICDPLCIALVSEHGLALGEVQKQWFCHCLMAEDRLIYVSPEHRKGREGICLIKAYVAEAKRMGAAEVFIGNATGINSERVGRLYERLGFKQIGGYYVMEG